MLCPDCGLQLVSAGQGGYVTPCGKTTWAIKSKYKTEIKYKEWQISEQCRKASDAKAGQSLDPAPRVPMG